MQRIVVLAASLVVGLLPASSRAQVGNPFDHLKCYKVKDPTKATYVADLVPLQQPPFQVEPGCRIKMPARLFCIPVQKTKVQPAPPAAVNGVQAQDYLVYQIKCPATTPIEDGQPLPVGDQFGSRTVKMGRHAFLMVPAFKQSTLCHDQSQPGTPPVCGGDCQDPSAKCVQIPGTTTCGCQRPCGVDAAGTCGGTCPAASQTCQIVTLADGTLECTCDPPVDLCHLEDPATGVCGGECTDPAARCALSTAGVCECIRPCGPTGIRQCGGTCPNAGDNCQMKPDDSGCECVGTGPTPCGMNAAGQCGGTCPVNLQCLHSGPVPGGTCVCGIWIPPQ